MRALPNRIQIAAGFAIATWLFATPALSQNTWYVDDDAAPGGNGSWSHPFRRIQDAVGGSGTTSGDSIVVRPGLYRERLDFGHSLTLIGEAGPDQTIVDADARGSALTIRNRGGWPSYVTGLTLRNGTGRYNAGRGESLGGGVHCVNSSVTIENCRIEDNATRVGGKDSEIVGRGGGVYAGVSADVTLIGCTIDRNDAQFGAGILVDRGSLRMLGGRIAENRALGAEFDSGRGGGALVLAEGRLELSQVDVLRNLALGSMESVEALGGGLRFEAGSHGLIDACRIEANDSGGFSLGYGDLSGYGGGVSSMARGAEFTMRGTLVRANWGNNGGGGVHGKGRLENCTLEENHGQYGGGAHAVDLELYDCVLRSNWGGVSGDDDWGAGIFVGPGRRGRLERCELASNHAYPQGGGGWGGEYVDCDIHDNTARGDGTMGFVGGGGVFGGVLIGCRVWGNRTDDYENHDGEGGGLYGGSALRTVFFDNYADGLAGGAASSTLEHCTVVDNWTGVAECVVRNSIVRFNGAHDVDFCPSVTWSNVPPGVLGAGNLSGDPLFVNRAGRDYRLQPGSPCIDAGDPTSPPDPDGSRADMGALPFGG